MVCSTNLYLSVINFCLGRKEEISLEEVSFPGRESGQHSNSPCFIQ